MQEIKKIFDWHTGSNFQSISGAISFQTSMVATVAFWTVRVDADMLDQPAAHMISLMDFMPGDDQAADDSRAPDPPLLWSHVPDDTDTEVWRKNPKAAYLHFP